eukprot:52308-Eustigmatos_ZCMA.PRE.1
MASKVTNICSLGYPERCDGTRGKAAQCRGALEVEAHTPLVWWRAQQLALQASPGPEARTILSKD